MQLRTVLSILALSGCLAVGAAAIGCDTGDDGNGTPQDAAVTQDASGMGTGVFGDPCTVNADCESNVCFEFGDGTVFCTLTCQDNTDCPDGSQGQKCNNFGYCRP